VGTRTSLHDVWGQKWSNGLGIASKYIEMHQTRCPTLRGAAGHVKFEAEAGDATRDIFGTSRGVAQLAGVWEMEIVGGMMLTVIPKCDPRSFHLLQTPNRRFSSSISSFPSQFGVAVVIVGRFEGAGGPQFLRFARNTDSVLFFVLIAFRRVYGRVWPCRHGHGSRGTSMDDEGRRGQGDGSLELFHM